MRIKQIGPRQICESASIEVLHRKAVQMFLADRPAGRSWLRVRCRSHPCCLGSTFTISAMSATIPVDHYGFEIAAKDTLATRKISLAFITYKSSKVSYTTRGSE